ncbi:unnamed protein product [Miscanthus lutarioriparius]|uniref:Uncharacterized protein n=1 Tax=Miscanthus lutarioriparius TaxID=422564 RepID=A0A811RNK3_9POAL|nr:unnamed protein product [Miscanthus lutarioriparius]
MADANKRINLTAPLLSVRRHGGGGAETAATGLPPAYKADATSEPPGHTSAVPFGWEQRPGHPKSVRTRRPAAAAAPPPPLTIVDVNDNEPSRVTRSPAAVVTVASERARRGEERCSDALSRDDVSCVTVNCSATGLSDAAGAGAGPCARGSGSVMMDRFLPAAHAVAAGSPQNTFRKAGSARAAVVLGARAASSDRVPAQRRVPLQHIAAYHLPPLPPSGKNDDDDNSDAHSTAGFASKSCGLLSARCLKSALLLSRVARRGAGTPFQEVRGELLLPPRSRNGQHQLLHTGDDHGMISQQSWEEVYIKSLLRSSGPGVLMGPAAAVASELDRTVRELYKRRDGQAVRPKASHLGLLLVLDRSNEACGHVSPARKLSRTGDTAMLLKTTTKARRTATSSWGVSVTRPPMPAAAGTVSRCFWKTRRPLPDVRWRCRRSRSRCSRCRCPSRLRSRGSRARCLPCPLDPRRRLFWVSMCSPRNVLRCRGAPLIRAGTSIMTGNGKFACTIYRNDGSYPDHANC